MTKIKYISIRRLLFDSSTDMAYRWFRHLIAGGTGTLFYILFTTLFVEYFSFHPVFAVFCSFILLIGIMYLINRVWVYNTSMSHSYAIPRFLTVVLISLGLNSSIMYLAVETFHLWYIYGLIMTVVIVPPTNFLLNYYWAFK